MVSGTKSREAYSVGKKHTVIAFKKNIGICQSLVHNLSITVSTGSNVSKRGHQGAVLVLTIPSVIVLEKVFVIGWRKEMLCARDGEGLTTRDDEGLH